MHERAPTAKDFSAGAVRAAVANYALQHPSTLAPLSFSGLGLLAGFLLGPGGFLVAFAGGLVGASSWVYHYYFRGERVAKEYVERALRAREAAEEEVIRTLVSDCERAGFEKGAQQVDESRTAFQKLKGRLESKEVDGSESSGAQVWLLRAEETYQRIIALLRLALEVHEALQSVDADALKTELAEWQRELKRLKKADEQGEVGLKTKIAALEVKVASHMKRLEAFTKRTELLDELLAECEKLEGALVIAHLELVDLIKPNGSISLSSGQLTGVTELEKAVAATRKVEEKLRSVTGTMTRDEEALYEQAAKDART
jgi:hypothetical protein